MHKDRHFNDYIMKTTFMPHLNIYMQYLRHPKSTKMRKLAFTVKLQLPKATSKRFASQLLTAFHDTFSHVIEIFFMF